MLSISRSSTIFCLSFLISSILIMINKIRITVRFLWFVIWEPECDQSHGDNLRNKALNITVAVSRLHIEANISFFDSPVLWILFIVYLCDGRVLYIDNIYASEVKRLGNLEAIDKSLRFSWLRESQVSAIPQPFEISFSDVIAIKDSHCIKAI